MLDEDYEKALGETRRAFEVAARNERREQEVSAHLRWEPSSSDAPETAGTSRRNVRRAIACAVLVVAAAVLALWL